jgi:thiamine-phosphate pyrophosphorylase
MVAAAESFQAASIRLAALATAAADAGVDIVQVRERDLQTSALVDLVGVIVDATRGSATRVVVNDRLDVAIASGAGGVHLRSDSLPAAAARGLVPPGFLVGRSVHRVDEAIAQASAADYLIAGTVFPTSSKPATDPLLGVGGLTAIVRSTAVPVLAIGGVDLPHVPEVAAAGASGIAGIGLFLEPTRSLADVVAAVRAQFHNVQV